MLQKIRDTAACIPDGLMNTSVELTKGMAVVRKLNKAKGVYEIALPTAGEKPYGFVTLRIDEDTYKASHYDTIPAGVKAVVYTLVKDNEWKTDQFEGTLAIGDLVVANTTGKLKKTTEAGAAQFEVIGVQAAMAGYEYPMVVVKVL